MVSFLVSLERSFPCCYFVEHASWLASMLLTVRYGLTIKNNWSECWKCKPALRLPLTVSLRTLHGFFMTFNRAERILISQAKVMCGMCHHWTLTRPISDPHPSPEPPSPISKVLARRVFSRPMDAHFWKKHKENSPNLSYVYGKMWILDGQFSMSG